MDSSGRANGITPVNMDTISVMREKEKNEIKELIEQNEPHCQKASKVVCVPRKDSD